MHSFQQVLLVSGGVINNESSLWKSVCVCVCVLYAYAHTLTHAVKAESRLSVKLQCTDRDFTLLELFSITDRLCTPKTDGGWQTLLRKLLDTRESVSFSLPLPPSLCPSHTLSVYCRASS